MWCILWYVLDLLKHISHGDHNSGNGAPAEHPDDRDYAEINSESTVVPSGG